MGVSAYLAPNSLLLLGQHDTLDRFQVRLKEESESKFSLRKNHNRWPPLHTPIVWDKCIPNRAALLMHALPGGFTAPKPPIISMVTGTACYTDYNAREILHRWVDHPQRLWDVVYELLSQGIETIIHVGPEPNIIPATFERLSENIQSQLKANYGMRAMSSLVTRPWLNSVLPSRAALLRAPLVKHVILEDWLLENAPS
jgi:[acyl-carrier-protein] S-malonyltransferase